MLRVLLVLVMAAFLAPGSKVDQKPAPKQPNPLDAITSCEDEENAPPMLCPPHCDC